MHQVPEVSSAVQDQFPVSHSKLHHFIRVVRALPTGHTGVWREADTTETTVTGLNLYAFCYWLNGKLTKTICDQNAEFGTKLSGSWRWGN